MLSTLFFRGKPLSHFYAALWAEAGKIKYESSNLENNTAASTRSIWKYMRLTTENMASPLIYKLGHRIVISILKYRSCMLVLFYFNSTCLLST